jgi:hypothetical protein
MAKPVIVVGDGWGALTTVAHLLSQPKSESIVWIAGSVSRALSPLPTVHLGFAKLARHFNVELGHAHTSNGRNAYSTYLREFKNKAFREPVFSKGESRQEALQENLWGPEQTVALLTDYRFDLSAAEIEESLRAKIFSTHPVCDGLKATPFPASKLTMEKRSASFLLLDKSLNAAE